MRAFDILNPSQNIHQNYILEASAGTGKTFAIENLVVRLLIEEKNDRPVPRLEELLIMTFTRAAARDLRERIRSTIQLSIDYLNQPVFNANAPLYLEKFFLEGKQNSARRRLQAALFTFSQASIFTIHSFCSQSLNSHLLEADIACHMRSQENSTLTQHYLRQLVRDFLHTRVKPGECSAAQLYTYCKGLRWDSQALENRLVKQISNRHQFEAPHSFLQLFEQFQAAILALKRLGIHSTQLRADFFKLAPHYKGLYNQSKQIKPEVTQALDQFIKIFECETLSLELFEIFAQHGCPFSSYFQPQNLKNKVTPAWQDLAHPSLLNDLQTHLLPILSQLTQEKFEAKLFHDCQEHVSYHLKEEEMLRHDDLLFAMAEASQQALFIKAVQARYKAVVVDEFQDTDPIQWQIFKNLFLSETEKWKGYLYLVGDPKQSIYAFRKADIYTYLDAQAYFSDHSIGTLDTNYRSEKPLITALNAIFDSQYVPQLIHLPKRQLTLPYRPVQTGVKELTEWRDNKGSIHVLVATEAHLNKDEADSQFFVPSFANEAKRLKQDYAIAYRRMAILVSDRYQAKITAETLRKCGVPCMEQKCASLVESGAMIALQEALRTILNPRNESLLKQTLGNTLFGFSYEQLCALDDIQFRAETLSRFIRLRKVWREEGFSSLFLALLQSQWIKNELCLAERLLNESQTGEAFYCDLQQLADILIAHQSETRCTPEKLLFFLETLDQRSDEDDDRLKKRADSTQEAISILTIHSSKGLEYDIVFPIGLHRPIKDIKGLISIGESGVLTAVEKTDPHYLMHQQELESESLRLFYVALTRAKKRLYFPVISNPKKSNPSPNDLYFGIFHYQQEFPLSGKEAFLKFIEEKGKEFFITSELLERPVQITSSPNPIDSIKLQAPPSAPPAPEPKLMHSYTSLVKTTSVQPFTSTPAPKDFNSFHKTAHTLPVGLETGIYLHRLLQIVPFDIETVAQMEIWLKSHHFQPLFKEWISVCANILFQTLNCRLPGIESSFSLSKISLETSFRECEFFFSPTKATADKLEISSSSFLRGTIDLLFYHNGFYYLLDWKSNWLGPDDSFYNKEYLWLAAEQNGYFLQAKLYYQALKQYLANIEVRPFEECFGGYYILFLRGVSQDKGLLWLPNSLSWSEGHV